MLSSADTSAEPSVIRIPLTRSITDMEGNIDNNNFSLSPNNSNNNSSSSIVMPSAAPTTSRAITEPTRTDLAHAQQALRDEEAIITGNDADTGINDNSPINNQQQQYNNNNNSNISSPSHSTNNQFTNNINNNLLSSLQLDNSSLRSELNSLQLIIRNQREQLRDHQSTSRELLLIRDDRDRLQSLLNNYSHNPNDTARIISSLQDELNSLRSEKHDWHRQLSVIDSESHRKERALILEQESLENRLNREQDEVDRLQFEQLRLNDQLSLTISHCNELKNELLIANDRINELKLSLNNSHRQYEILLASWRDHDNEQISVHWRAKSFLYSELFHIAKLTKENEFQLKQQKIEITENSELTEFVENIEKKFHSMFESINERNKQILNLQQINSKLLNIIQNETKSQIKT